MNLLKDCRKIVAIGRNYAAHAAELGNKTPSHSPLIFLKPPSSLLTAPNPIRIPPPSPPHPAPILHHEVELAIIMNGGGCDIPRDRVHEYIHGYALALDMTARNWQQEASRRGEPWTLAKGCDTFTPISDIIGKHLIPSVRDVRLWCRVNGEMRQDGRCKDMVFGVEELVSYCSRYMKWERGDLLLTGTPAGVGPVTKGDQIECALEVGNSQLQRFIFTVQ
jgi:acylpyruvate hydrolase